MYINSIYLNDITEINGLVKIFESNIDINRKHYYIYMNGKVHVSQLRHDDPNFSLLNFGTNTSRDRPTTRTRERSIDNCDICGELVPININFTVNNGFCVSGDD